MQLHRTLRDIGISCRQQISRKLYGRIQGSAALSLQTPSDQYPSFNKLLVVALVQIVMFFPGVHYGLPYPHHEFQTGRNLRMSPVYPTLRDNGAVFGQVMGYERPAWFETVGTNIEQ